MRKAEGDEIGRPLTQKKVEFQADCGSIKVTITNRMKIDSYKRSEETPRKRFEEFLLLHSLQQEDDDTDQWRHPLFQIMKRQTLKLHIWRCLCFRNEKEIRASSSVSNYEKLHRKHLQNATDTRSCTPEASKTWGSY
ncbi:hypothetical protein PTKIN_Ptkin01aG0326900 [Pterospermum kingtungense]